MKLLSVGLINAIVAVTATYAQAPARAILVPAGNWQYCLTAPDSPVCGQTPPAPGFEPFQLLIANNNPNAIGYVYTIIGTDLRGVTRTFTGYVPKNDRASMGSTVSDPIATGQLSGVVIGVSEMPQPLANWFVLQN